MTRETGGRPTGATDEEPPESAATGRRGLDWPTRDLLSYRTAATPDRRAVVDVATGREWSYREFDDTVAGTAAALEKSLTGMDVADSRPRIALLASTRPVFVAAFHAGLRTGARLAPLNVRLAKPQLRERIERVDPDLLVCERDTESAGREAAGCPVVSLDTPVTADVERLPTVDRTDGAGTAVEPARWERDETALLLFTSGTTGEPKCVRLTLGNLVSSASAAAFRLGVAPGDRWLDCLPVYHTGGLAPLVRCPLYGTTLLVQGGFEAGRTADAMADRAATGVSLVPTQLHRLLAGGWRPPDSLGTVLLGGAPADPALVERALEAGVPVYPTYGLTEAASQVATATPALAREYPASVGQPLVVTSVTILGDGGPVDPGETGELVVDGPTVTPGYLDPERTAAAFGEYGLRTGDIGYRDADGRLWVLGRADDTIVTGGENVHPSTVEPALCEHPGVAEAAVVGVPDEEWGQRVGAVVVASGDVTAGGLQEFARERLAGYEIPRTIRFADELPRTHSGTVDRAAVRELLEG
jgi:O-succinylbenzoic acid--CoA ligase